MTSEDVLERLGLTAAELSGGSLVRPLADRRRRDRPRPRDAGRRHAGDHRARPQRLPRLARGSGAAAGRARASAGEELRAAKEALGRAGHARGRQDRLRGPRRSAGDDRHLRFRRRPVAAAVRPDHRLRAPGPSHDRDLASAGAVRDHLRLQFPGRGLVLERGAGAGVRRCRDLEAVGEDAAHGAGDDENPATARIERFGPDAPEGLAQLVIGGPAIGEALVASKRVPIVSATGSTRMGRSSAPRSPRGSAARSSSSAATTR